jgi:hypothetical protein
MMKRFWKRNTPRAWCGRLSYAACITTVGILLFAPGARLVCAQSPQASQLPGAQEAGLSQRPSGGVPGVTLHVTTREVVVEVVARDHKGHPVNDLTQSDFEVFEGTHTSKEATKRITGFRTIDPDSETNDIADHSRSVVLPLGGRCEIRSTVHYELAFHPSKWTSGYHSITVATTRGHITLSYRNQYYVGVADAPIRALPQEVKSLELSLQRAACFHSDVPSSVLLSAKRIKNTDASKLRYAVTVLPGSLSMVGMGEDAEHVQLEYAVCTFSRSGGVMDFWQFSETRALSHQDLEAVLAEGWKESVDVPRSGRPALARFVVLEPNSGNLGAVDLSTGAPTDADETDADPAVKVPTRVLADPAQTGVSKESSPLGSPVAKTGALCGDVYELPTTTKFLPSDFKVLNAVGAVYADSLSAPEQMLRQGIPGSTPRAEWFGIDYYGEFWITKPGKYHFVLNADDGADLFIDEHRLIDDDGIHPPQTAGGSMTLDAGRHTLHMPYFQGPTYVNLILQIKPPDGDLKTFDVRDYPDPARAKH